MCLYDMREPCGLLIQYDKRMAQWVELCVDYTGTFVMREWVPSLFIKSMQ